MQLPPLDLWARTRVPRITFLVGLVIGLIGGWFFHGVISIAIRFFFVLVLLIPLAIALYFWFRLRRNDAAGPAGPTGGMTVISLDQWEAGGRYGQPRRGRRIDPEDGPG